MAKSYYSKEFKYQLRQLQRRWAKPFAQVLIATVISAGTLFFWISDSGQKLDLWVLSKFFEVRGERTPPEDIVIVAIDDVSYQKLEASARLPFPRIFVAEAIEEIVEAGPRVLIIDASVPKERIDLEADRRLEEALRKGPTTIYSGIVPTTKKREDDEELMLPSEDRFRAAAKMELSMLVSHRFGIRSYLAADTSADATLYERVPISRALIELGKYKIGMPSQLAFINYYGPKGTIKRISLYELVREFKQDKRSELKDKVVFFGYQSLMRERGQISKEEFDVPVSEEPMYGVEIHANIAGNLIDGSWLERLSVTEEMSVIFIVSLLMAVIGIAASPEMSAVLISLLLGVCTVVDYYLFTSLPFWVPGMGALMVAGLVTILGNAFYHYVIIKKFRDYVRRTFKFEFEKGE